MILEWQPIGTAPEHEYVLVAGWQPPRNFDLGYWWVREDYVSDNKPALHPKATLWCHIIHPPFPEPGVQDAEERLKRIHDWMRYHVR